MNKIAWLCSHKVWLRCFGWIVSVLIIAGVLGCQTAVSPTPSPSIPTVTLSPTPLPAPTAVPTPIPGILYVDTAVVLGTINPLVYGTNYGPWVTVPFDLLPQAENAGIRLLRFPGGNWGDQNNITHRQIDQFIALAERMGAEPHIVIRLENGSIEKAVELLTYTNIEKGYGVRYWAIGNEPSLYDTHPGYETYDTVRYNQEWRKFAEAMLAVDPTIQLIGPDPHQYSGEPNGDPLDSNGRPWLRSFLEANGDLVNVVSIHRYPFPRSMTSTTTIAELRESSAEWDKIIPDMRAMILETTGRDIPVGVMEINSHWSKGFGGEATPDSHYNAIWWGDVLGRMINNGVDMVGHFVLQTKDAAGGWGLLGRSDVRPTYYVYQLYQRFGTIRLYAASGIPHVSVYAATHDDGTLTLIVINLGNEEVKVPVQIAGEVVDETAVLFRLDPSHSAENLGEQPFGSSIILTLPEQSISLYIAEEKK